MSEVEDGRWRAEIWPASCGEYPVAFFVIDGPTPLAEMIADYRWKEAEYLELVSTFDNLRAGVQLPKLAEPAGEREFDRFHDEIWQSSGLAVSEAASNKAYDAKLAARNAIFRYRASTMSEVAMKNAFVAGLVSEGYELTLDDLAAIFAVANK